MSGRDFKNFLSSHQYQMGRSTDPKLMAKVMTGSRVVGTYKEVDYEKMKALVKLKRSAGESSLKKLEQVTKAREDKKEKSLLQQHKKVWHKEHTRLKHALEKIEHETDICISKFSDSDWTFLNELYFEITSMIEAMKDSRNQFQTTTVQPLWDLREDLQYWIDENGEQVVLGMAEEDHSRVLDVAKSVKEQQTKILDQLNHQEAMFQGELDIIMTELGFEQVYVKFPHVYSGIPNGACESECYDENLKASCLAEFSNLDYKHELHFKYLEEKYEDAIKRAPTGKWSQDEHFCFQHILEQYLDEKHDRRALYMDRLMRSLPHFTRSEIVEHEDWWFSFKSFQNQFKDQLHAWQRDRDDLLLKITAVFAEANVAHEFEKERVADRQRQAQICEKWHEKVKNFQMQKQELMKLEAALKEKREEEEKEERRKAEEKEKNRRSKMKTKVDEYHAGKEQRMKLEREKEQERLIELKAEMEQQRIVDRERVEFREKCQQEKEEQKKLSKEREKELEDEKEQRLEKLRMQVRVEAPVDALRVMEPTEAYQARQAAKLDEEKELQEPLFSVHTFNSKQVLSDSRLKVEKAFRDAGIQNSDYARQVLSKVAPPTIPRKDTTSSVFKQN